MFFKDHFREGIVYSHCFRDIAVKKSYISGKISRSKISVEKASNFVNFSRDYVINQILPGILESEKFFFSLFYYQQLMI